MIVPIPVVHIGMGVIIALVSVPLALGRVPMNRFYGVRIPKAYTSEQNWYAINRVGGVLLVAYGLFLLIFGLGALGLAPSPRTAAAPLFLAAPLLLILPVLAAIFAYASRLP
jgi:hypothetical protein